MRQYPTDDYDIKESAKLFPQPWMLETLKLNPSYTSWGVHEDYMMKDGNGWDSRQMFSSWAGFRSEFGDLDDLNECVHFYFEIERPSVECDVCGGTGHHPDAQWITESWYRHSSPFTKPDQSEWESKAILAGFGCDWERHQGVVGRGVLPPDEVLSRYGKEFLEHCVQTIDNGGAWQNAITQDEVDALWESKRLWGFKSKPTAAEVNAEYKNAGIGGHDAINRMICCKQRCKRLGVPYLCDICKGDGIQYNGDAYLSVTLWILHPRKGCSRVVQVSNIQEIELREVFEYLSTAAERNANRFKNVVDARQGVSK